MDYTKAIIVEKSADEFTAIASTEAQDRHGDIIKQDGWDLKNYKDNPILLFMHDHTKPIGSVSKIWVEKASKGAKMFFKGTISSATEVSRAARQLMQEGILNSFSVGFMPKEMEGNMITKAELHEISLVSVPANYEARLVATKSLEKAGFKDEVIKEFVTESADELREKVIELEEQVKKATELAETAVKGLQHLAPLNRSSQAVVTERLHHSKVIAKAADKLLSKNVSRDKAIALAKVMKRSSEKLIRSNKEDL